MDSTNTSTTTPVDTNLDAAANTSEVVAAPTMETSEGETLTPETASKEQVEEAMKTTEEQLGLDIQSMFLADSQGNIPQDLSKGLYGLVSNQMKEIQRKFIIEKLGLAITTVYDECLIACVQAGYRLNAEATKIEAGKYSFELQLLRVEMKETYNINCTPNLDIAIV